MYGGKRILLIFAALFWVTALCPAAGGAEQALPEDVKACLDCHGRQGLTITFQNNETLPAYVDAKKFTASVHQSLSCTACHGEFSAQNHPQRTFQSREQYAVKASLVCRQCHDSDQLKKSPVHAALVGREGAAPVCTTCHSAHAVTAVAGGTKFKSEQQYCLTCHRHAVSMSMKNGEAVSLKVDPSALEISVHAPLTCFDCHFGFSRTQHPKRAFGSARDFTLVQSESCRRCHFDKYTKTLESIHYTMLSQGNLKAPVCVDCHGAHGVTPPRVDRVRSARQCGKCHGDVFTAYARSVHGNALVQGHSSDVPVCVDCHTAHTILDARTQDYREKVPEICGRCHGNRELMKKYGLNTGVVNSYLQDFHGVTLKLYKQQKTASTGVSRKSIATCVDCHGIHDITRTSGPGTNLVKARLVKRCQKCHPGAGEEFPDAWLSHYEPSLSNAPLVFVINLMYTIFIPFMLIGLILQILLHIWRYAVNR